MRNKHTPSVNIEACVCLKGSISESFGMIMRLDLGWCLKNKHYLFYNDKETVERMMAQGRRLCGRQPDYAEKTVVVEQVTT